MSKKKTLLFLVMAACLLLCACAGNVQAKNTDSTNTDASFQDINTPDGMAEYVMGSLKSLDLDTFNQCTDNHICTHRNWIGMPTSREYRVFNELLQPALIKGKHYKRNYSLSQKLMENLSWEITKVRESEETAEIDMSITNIDMGAVMGEYTVFLLENMAESEGIGITSMMRDLSNLTRDMDGLISIMDSMGEENTCTKNITLSAWLDNGTWKLHISDEFINAFMGNINSEEYSPETIEKIEILEKKIEDKAETWAEGFEDKIEGLFD